MKRVLRIHDELFDIFIRGSSGYGKCRMVGYDFEIMLKYIKNFIFGWLGTHKFYAGKIKTEILYLLFSWTGIPAVIGVIDAITGRLKKADTAENILV